jgi:lipooligosaccharide transport system permease protein
MAVLAWQMSRAKLLVERNLLVYRHGWFVILSGFFEPLFYLLSIGVGIGHLVGHVEGPNGQAIAYTAFVAPALLAASAMNGAIYDATFNVFFKLKMAKLYDGVLATPMGVRDVALGELSWALMRGTMYSTAFLVIMLAMGLVSSWWAMLVLPVAVLIAAAFGSIGMASVSFFRTYQDFEWIQLAIMPMFLFSATFYPLSTYPRVLQVVVEWSPLYQGIALTRALTTGIVHPGLLWHVLYLIVLVVAGLALTARQLERLLLR